MARNLGVPCADNKPYYFVSYNSEDEKNVSGYARVLTDAGVPLWYDNGLKVGDEWEEEIASRIENCEAVIMFLSRNIFLKNKSYVQKEYIMATERSKKKVYVMILDKIELPDVPGRFAGWWIDVTQLQCINTYDYASCQKCVEKLLQDLSGFKGKINNASEMSDSKSDSISYELFGVMNHLTVTAETYSLKTNDELNGFVRYLLRSGGTKDEAYKCARGLLSLSRILMDVEILNEPLHFINDEELLLVITERLDTIDILKSKDFYTLSQYRSSVKTYRRYITEKY